MSRLTTVVKVQWPAAFQVWFKPNQTELLF